MAMRGRVVVATGDLMDRGAIAEVLQDAGYEVATAANPGRALAENARLRPHVVLLEVGLDAEVLVDRLRATLAPPLIVALHEASELTRAIALLRRGADDRLQRPLHRDELLVVLDRVRRIEGLRRERDELREIVDRPLELDELDAVGPAMQPVVDAIASLGPAHTAALISGERGTGKERVADALHRRWCNAGARLAIARCAALTDLATLDLAPGDTLFLDEVGELSAPLQLAVLELSQRIIGSTSRPLAGAIHPDLLARLASVHLRVPPLRDRPGDLPALVQRLLEHHARSAGTRPAALSAAASARLYAHAWPGNLRELAAAIAYAVERSGGRAIDTAHLPATVRGRPGAWAPGTSLDALERHAILATLASVGGSLPRAATILGLSVRTIQYRLQRYRA